jgi:uncharacterized protein with PIN domain
MNFLADESCAGPVIRALREAGHDVVAIAEVAKGATDEHVLEGALNEKRVLITEDRDFGELVYARGRSSAGVILVRFHSRARRAKPATVVGERFWRHARFSSEVARRLRLHSRRATPFRGCEIEARIWICTSAILTAGASSCSSNPSAVVLCLHGARRFGWCVGAKRVIASA